MSLNDLVERVELDHPAGSIDAELEQILGDFDPADLANCPITTFTAGGHPCCY